MYQTCHLEIQKLNCNFLDELLQEWLAFGIVLVMVEDVVQATMRDIFNVTFGVVAIFDLK